MNNVSGRLTMYDFLGILTPGIVVVYGFLKMNYPCALESKALEGCCCQTTAGASTLAITCQIIAFFALAYITGLLISTLSEGMWLHFRNNCDFLKLQLRRLIERGDGSYRLLEKEFNISPDQNKCCVRCFSWYSDMILAYVKLILCLPFAWLRYRLKRYPGIEKIYYQAYYWLIKNGKVSSSVGVIESQVCFLRNMLLPLVLWCFFPCGVCSPLWLRIALLAIAFVTMVSRQNRVYMIVLEDYQWYNK